MDSVIGLYTVAKFHSNTDEDSTNRILTRTLGKFGLINRDYKGEYPKPEEFWIVQIVNNIKPNQTQGCFILNPIKKVDFKEIGKLVSGMYTSEDVGPVVQLIVPLEQYRNKLWQMPLEERRLWKKKAVLVQEFYNESQKEE